MKKSGCLLLSLFLLLCCCPGGSLAALQGKSLHIVYSADERGSIVPCG